MKTKSLSQFQKIGAGFRTGNKTLSSILFILGLPLVLMLSALQAMALEITYSGRLSEESG